MKQLNVLAFGAVAEITGDKFTLMNIDSTGDLQQQLGIRFPDIKNISYAIAVDKTVVNTNTVLHNNATVAILPPFSGG